MARSGKEEVDLRKLLLPLLMVIVFTLAPLSPVLAQEAREDLTLVLNSDGTLLMKGVIEAVLQDFNAIGQGDLYLSAQPANLNAGEGYTLEVGGSGEFTLTKPLNLTRVEVSAQGEGSMTQSSFELTVVIQDLSAAGDVLSGTIDLNVKSEPETPGDPTMLVTSAYATLDLQFPIDPDVAAQLSGMLGMLNAGLVNMQLSQMGMTFLTFKELDLTGLTISEQGISGNIRMVLVFNYEDYITWYKAMLFEMGVPQDEIEEKGAQLEQVLQQLLSEHAVGRLTAELIVESNRLSYNLELKAEATRTFVDAYIKYLELLGQGQQMTPPAGGMAPAPIEVPIQQTQPPLTIAGNITLAPGKPLKVNVTLEGDGNIGTLRINIEEAYLTVRNAPPSYDAAVETLRELARQSQGNDTLEKITITLDQPQAGVSIVAKPPLPDYVETQEPGRIVLRAVQPQLLENIVLEGEAKQQPSQPPATQSPTQTQEMARGGEEYKEYTETPQTTPMQQTTQTETQTPMKEEARTTTSPQEVEEAEEKKIQQEQGQEQEAVGGQAEAGDADQEQAGGGLLGGNLMILAGIAIVALAVALILRR